MIFLRRQKWIFCFFLFLLIFTVYIDTNIEAARVTDEQRIAPARPGRNRPPRARRSVSPKPVKQQIQAPEEKEQLISMDFKDVDIGIFIKFISDLTDRNFIIDKKVKGKITIISPTKISIDEAYKVFESVLEVHGYATVEAGEVTKIIPSPLARTKNIETRLREEASSPEDKVITQLIHLRYADPGEIKKLFTPLISKSSVILSYPATNMLIITDVLSNIQRLLRIITAIDVEGVGREISIVSIKYATATDIVKTLSSVFQAKSKSKRSKTTTVKIVSDERTNSIIILASENDIFKIKQLISYLDRKVPRGEGKIRVYYLEHATAEDLVKVLKDLPSKQSKKTTKGKAPIISKDVRIAADKATNSLIITAERDDYLVLEEVIKKLDIPRSMVYIEALIMEVTVNKSLDLGIDWLAGGEVNDGAYFGGFGSLYPMDIGTETGLGTLGTAIAGSTVGVVGNTIKLGDSTFSSIAAFVKAIRTNSDFNIISTPQILTTDNEEAEISVGQNVPYQTRSSSTDTSSTVYSNFEYKDVGTTLKVTPQISNNRFIRLKLEQEVKRVIESQVESSGQVILAPTTATRSSKTTVIVRDSETIVIGGLIDNELQEKVNNIPCLGSIPILGWLFKNTSNTDKKTNLFIFLTPYIIQNTAQSKEFFNKKIDKIEKGIEQKIDFENGNIKMYKKGEK
ncbi:general secretion pathway protein D [Candidatus Magnetomoraceae bacterium gMMP-15]